MLLKHPRLLLGSVAATGAIETGYLSLSKYFSTSIANLCTNNSCNDVLTGPYSVVPVLNIPLVSIAFVLYTSVAVLSVLPTINGNNNNNSDRNTDRNSDASIVKSTQLQNTSAIILFLTIGMATFSTYLMGILNFVIHSSCPYCYLSAVLSVTMAIIAWNANLVPNKTKAFAIASTSMSLTAITSGFLFYLTSAVTMPEAAQASTAPAAQVLARKETEKSIVLKAPPKITTHSSPRSLALAERMKLMNAKMYGAYWCSHCYNQKQVLGEEAFSLLEYNECDKEGYNSQYGICRAKNVS